MKTDSIINRLVNHISTCKLGNVIAVTTAIVVFVSVPLVYSISLLFEKEFTQFLLIVSVALPLIITPIILIIVAELSKHLEYYKKNLEDEIAKNKKKDLMMFEQARFVLMGEMMANISHQWKQPLNTMGLAIISARFEEHTKDQLEKKFDILEDNISYLSTTIDDFMSFFDKRTPDEYKTLNSIIHEIKSIIGAQIDNKGINLTFDIDDKLKTIEMKTAISQVLLNLLNNAKDAIDNKAKPKNITLQFTASKKGLEISCCDSGSGINPKIADKVFDPYFTTKEKKQGTGIGLYMSKEIISKIFDGTIRLETHTKDTCFVLNIPCSKNCILESVL